MTWICASHSCFVHSSLFVVVPQTLKVREMLEGVAVLQVAVALIPRHPCEETLSAADLNGLSANVRLPGPVETLQPETRAEIILCVVLRTQTRHSSPVFACSFYYN